MECSVKTVKGKCNSYNVVIKGATRGGILAVKNALEKHAADGSAVAEDVLSFLRAAVIASADVELVRDVIFESDLVQKQQQQV